MKAKILAVVLVVWCAMAAAPAYSVDAQYTVNGNTITCTVTEYPLFGLWNRFVLDYGFCDDNHRKYTCVVVYKSTYYCEHVGGPATQYYCNGSRYDFKVSKGPFAVKLEVGTSGAQKKVCDQLFDSLKVSVTPLK